MFFILLFNIITANLDQTQLINNKIKLNACKDYLESKNIKYTWEIIEKPKNSSIKNEDIIPNNSSECFSSFEADKIGKYSIKLKIKSDKIREKLINILVLNNYKTNNINFDIISKNKFYQNELNYYKDKNLNYIYKLNLYSPLNIKTNVKGNFYIENLQNKKTYLLYDIDNFQFYKNKRYKLTLLKKGFKIFNTEIENDNEINIELIPIEEKKIIITNNNNKIIDGYFHAKYENKNLISKNSNELDGSYQELYFYPIKNENNYPNMKFDVNNINENIKLKKQIFYNLNFKIKENLNILIKSKNFICSDDNSIKCNYQKRINTSSDIKIKLPQGDYEIEAFKNQKTRKKYNLKLNKNEILNIEKLEQKEEYNISISKNIVKSIFINNKEKTKYIFFKSNFKLLKGVYNITLFNENTYYRIKDYEVSSDTNLELETNRIMLNLYYKNNELFNDFIIFENGYYININNYLIDLNL